MNSFIFKYRAQRKLTRILLVRKLYMHNHPIQFNHIKICFILLRWNKNGQFYCNTIFETGFIWQMPSFDFKYTAHTFYHFHALKTWFIQSWEIGDYSIFDIFNNVFIDHQCEKCNGDNVLSIAVKIYDFYHFHLPLSVVGCLFCLSGVGICQW